MYYNLLPYYSLEESLELSEREYQENNLAEWRKASEPVTQWIITQKQRLESLQGVAEDLDTVQKQKEEENVSVLRSVPFNVTQIL